ncbi:MAG: PSD1 and planctomycete cytochrome C domain-containing protein [Verrucomicrobiales bacterium]
MAAAPSPAAAAPAELPADHAARMKAGTALFQNSVRASLADHCLRCHGGEKVRGDFDLSSRELLLEGGESGPAVDLAEPGESLLLKLIEHREKPAMPAKKPKLDDATIAAIAEWIALGAPYDQPLAEKAAGGSRAMQVTDTDRRYWAFQPLRLTDPPEAGGDWAKSDLDRFVAAKLAEADLQPSAAAEPRAFIRRAYLDLTGMPPAPEAVDAFAAAFDADADRAVDALIQELLGSPSYGERWARHWLDVARFAESHGFEQDYDRPYAFHYRDFVIRALNADMPYDQFVRWQLAGDEFAPGDPLAMAATGFLGAGVFPTQLTEKEFESARYDELDDMAATMGTAMLGLTIGCARCHDHKFDPIPMEDYYRLVSTFTTTIRSEIELPAIGAEDYEKQLAAWEAGHAEAVDAQRAYEESAAFQARFRHWLKGGARRGQDESPWQVLAFTEAKSAGGATLAPQPDGSVLLGGSNPAAETLTFSANLGGAPIRFLRIEALADPSFKHSGPGRAGNGNFALSDLRVSHAESGGGERKAIRLANPRATHQQNEGNLSVASAIDGDPRGTGWAVDFGGIGKDQAAVFELAEPASGGALVIEMKFANNGQHTIGRPRLSVSGDPAAPVAVGGGQPADLAAAFAALAANDLKPEHREPLLRCFAQSDPAWQKLAAAVRDSHSQKPARAMEKVMVSSEGLPHLPHHADGRGFPHFYKETYILTRGDVNQKGEVAAQGFLQVLMPEGKSAAAWQVAPPEGSRTSYRRRSLANWVTDADGGAGHLLARVIANRVWQHHFGRGIVATPNDFGLQGEVPTHPELLDYLAAKLIEGGWRLKPLHRAIMRSAVYRQSSAPDPGKAAADPENRWLWRFEPRRLEAEAIRDSMLAVSGELDPAMFGKGTLDEGHRRRSIYFMVKRSRLIPMMQVFDQPEPLVSQGERPTTTIAPQALLLMNHPQVVRYAAALASKADGGGTLEDAIGEIYRRALGRPPNDGELRENAAFVEAQMKSYGGGNARRLALADLCQVVFSLNEFAYLP